MASTITKMAKTPVVDTTLDLKTVFDKYLASQQQGGTPLTEEESAVLMNPATLNQFYQLARDSGVSQEELPTFVAGARSQDKTLTQAQRDKRERSSVDAYNVGQALNTGRNLLQGVQQTNRGDRTLESLQGHPPQYAPLIAPNAALQQRMSQAQLQAETGLAPGIRGELNRQNADAYQKALDNAKAVGGGQGGQYAALAQQASLDRMRGNLQVGGLDTQARQQNQEAYDRLIPQDIAQRQFQQQTQDARFNNLTRPMYFGQLNSANQLAQTGRANVNDALATLPMMAGRLAKEYYPGQRGIPAPPAARTPYETQALAPISTPQPVPVNVDASRALPIVPQSGSFADIPMDEFINRYSRKRNIGSFKPQSY